MDKIEVTQWRKKPVVVEAMKYPGHTVNVVDTLLAFEDWIEPLAKAAGRWPLTYRGQSLIIPTLEGDHEAKPGDYIIRGVSGEIYPCKPDIFAKTYEPVPTYAHPPATDVAALVEAAKKIMPIRVNDGPDYADVYFADGVNHITHAMTMNPQDWLDLSAALAPFTKGQNDENA